MIVASYIYIGQFAPKDVSQLWIEPKSDGNVSLHVFSDGGWKIVGGGDGKSAYELAVEKGYSGTLDEWLEFLKGKSFTYDDLTTAQKAELAQDAVAAANRAAQAVETIEAAISDLDPSQSADDAVVALAARQGVLEAEVDALGPKIGQYDDKKFNLLIENFGGIENIADFSSFDSSDVTYNKIGANNSYSVSFSGNTITATQSANAGGSFAVDMADLNLVEGEKYLICVERIGQRYSQQVEITQNATSESSGNRVVQFTNNGVYQKATFTAAANRYLLFAQFYSETEINYNVYIYKITDIEKLVEQVSKNASDLEILPYYAMLFEVCFGIDAKNVADFSDYSSSDVVYNPRGLTIGFNGNKITSVQTSSPGNTYIGVSLNGLSLVEGAQYTMRVYRPDGYGPSNFSINKNTTSSSIGTTVANFTVPEDDSYVTATFVYITGLTLVWYHPYNKQILQREIYVCKEYEGEQGSNITETKANENFANRMSWELLKGTTSGVNSATKVENGVTIDMTTGANKIAVFLLPQLKEGHSYTLKIECSSLINQQTVRNTLTGSAVYTFSANSDVYTLNIQNYKEYYYPLYLALQLRYNVATHNVLFYITDDSEPSEKEVVKNSALYGIGERNISHEMLERCDYLQDVPTLYRGMDIVAFNKGICIGDSTTAGSLNTTDSQGSSGPNVPADSNKAYPAMLSKLTGIELTNAGDGGKTSYGYWTAHQNDDWSGYEFAIILLGINDVSSVGHGTWDNDSVTAFTNTINKLKDENTGIKVFVSTILNTQSYKNLGGGVNEGIAQLVEDLDDPDVILLDIHKYGRLNMTNAYSCGHPSQYGYYRLAQDYCNYISWYMSTHKEEFRFIQFIGTNYVYTNDY